MIKNFFSKLKVETRQVPGELCQLRKSATLLVGNTNSIIALKSLNCVN